MRRVALALVITASLLVSFAFAQPFPPSVQIAITQLTTGIIPFSILRMIPNGYVNFGNTSGVDGYGLRDNAGTIQFKQDGGSWVSLPASGTYPTGASYWTRVPEADLSNETALSALSTGLILNTTGTGVPVIYAGTSCPGQVAQGLSAAGVATCSDVDLDTLTVDGTLTVPNGGTGLTAGTSGGLLGFTDAVTLASSAELAANRIVLGGGAGATPSTPLALGTTAQVLHGNAAGAPTWGSVALTTDVSGILPSANGGTGSAFFGITGPTAARTFTFPDANATILTSAAAITPAQGGTGLTSYTTGDLIYASAGTTLSPLADIATGNVLLSGGVGAAPSYGKVGLTTHVSGTLPVANGGTNLTTYVIGDLLYASGTTALTRLAAVAAGQVLVSTGVGAAPAWSASPGSVTPLTALTSRLLTASGASTATLIQRLTSVATNDDVTEDVYQYRVATTDATITTLGTYTLTAFTTTQIDCDVTARRTGGSAGTDEDGAAYQTQAVYKVVAGVATEIGEVDTAIGEDQPTWDVSWSASGSDALLRVTGAVNNNVTWHATCRIHTVSS